MAEQIIHLLILDESSTDAEMLTNVLRNSALAVRAKRIEDEEDLEESLNQQRWDMLISRVNLTNCSASNAINWLQQHGKDIPVLVLTDKNDKYTTIMALTAGARDIIPLDEPEQIALVVKRELDNLLERRAHRQCKKAFYEAEKRSRALIDSSQDAIAYVHEGMHIYANPVYLEMFGYAEQDEIEGVPIMDMVAPDDHNRFKDFLRSFNKADEELKGEIEVKGISADSNEFDATMEFTPATMDGEHCTQIIIRQRSNKELEQQLKRLSERDLLTGLYNRQYFMDNLENAVAEATAGGPHSALLNISLDDFESTKQKMGVAESDLILGDVAEILTQEVKEPDIACRFEGQVFTVILRNTDSDKANSKAEHLKQLVADHIFNIGNQTVTLTASIGVCPITEQSDSADVVLSRADHAATVVSEKGGNNVHVHIATEDKDAGIELSDVWVDRIKTALKENGFRLVFQPIVSLHGDTNETYEVLLRMLGDNGEFIPPAQFMNIAEKARLMPHIDRWVIKNAFARIAQERKNGKQMRFFIKLSADSIIDKTLLPWISEGMKNLRITGDSVGFEVSEAVAMMHLTHAKTLINGLKQLRCNLVLDHFGTGLNPFNALKHLNVDYLKIDASLISELSSKEQSQMAVKSITEMAHSKGKLTIAEGVQDANSLAVLWQCGINYIQGYFLQEPNEQLDYDFSSTG
jgi:diguanylate cyclase (GGDEF)-like protein/PAS domain S-box-containing protein